MKEHRDAQVAAAEAQLRGAEFAGARKASDLNAHFRDAAKRLLPAKTYDIVAAAARKEWEAELAVQAA